MFMDSLIMTDNKLEEVDDLPLPEIKTNYLTHIHLTALRRITSSVEWSESMSNQIRSAFGLEWVS